MNVMRQVSVLIWNDDKFPHLSDDAQMVFFHLLTTPMTTTFGLFKAGVQSLAEEKRWPVDRYSRALQVLVSQNMVKYDEDSLLVYIPRALKYSPPSNQTVIKSWSEIFKSLPNSPLKRAFYQDLKNLVEEADKEPLTSGFDQFFGDGSDLSADDAAPAYSRSLDSLMTVSEQDNTFVVSEVS